MTLFLGIDPGANGCIACLDDAPTQFQDRDASCFQLSKATDLDIAAHLGIIRAGADARNERVLCVLEKVASSPQMGVKSAFTFGKGFGVLVGCLASAGIPYALVTPQKWQKAMGCLSGGQKNITKAAAQRLYPSLKITHATADSLLLATYCRKHCRELFGLAPSAGEG